jgi:ketosteroid isomerase-like protein
MSAENVERIARMLDRAQQEPELMYAVLAEDIEWDVRDLQLPGPAIYHGHDGVREFFREWVGAFDEWGYEIVELIDAGDATVDHIHQWGRGKGSGAPVEIAFWQVWTIQDGRVVRTTNHLQREQAFAAAGLDL